MVNKAQALDDKLKNLDIIEIGLMLLGDRVKKRPISPDYLGLCPVHDEKNPSFYLKARWNKYKCFGCGLEGRSMELPFEILGGEEGLSFLENKLSFSRTNIMEMAVLKWNIYRGLDGYSPGYWHFLEQFEPFNDWEKIEFGIGTFHLETMYRAALEGAVDLGDYLHKLEPKT